MPNWIYVYTVYLILGKTIPSQGNANIRDMMIKDYDFMMC